MTDRLARVQSKLASLHSAKRDHEAHLRRIVARIQRLDSEQRQLILAEEEQRRTLASRPMDTLSDNDLALVFSTLVRDARTALRSN